jgi:hypothetical protein
MTFPQSTPGRVSGSAMKLPVISISQSSTLGLMQRWYWPKFGKQV